MTTFRPVVAVASLALLAAGPLATPSEAKTRLIIRGGGFGHGVGMSQYGAMGYAENGKDYRFILGHYYTGTALGRLDANPTVRVLLQANRHAVVFTGARQAGDRRLNPSKTYRATAFGADQVVLRSSSGHKLRTMAAPLRVIGPGGEPLTLAGGSNSGLYRGALELRPAQFGGLNAINALGLEDYVRGVVSAESPSSWPAEALKAQAVAARTYAITTNKPGVGFDQYPDTRSQVYDGVAAETPTTDVAVAETRGEVVTYDGQPVVTYFFSTSGGRTENAEYGFPGGEPQPWLKSVEDPYDDVSPRHRWKFRYSLKSADRRLGSLVQGRLKRIRVTKRGVSPRVVSAQVVGSRGTTTISGPELRSRFGLYDTWAYFTLLGTKVKREKPQPDQDTGDGSTGAAMASAASVRRRGTVAGRVTHVARGRQVVVQRRTSAGTWTTEVRTHVGRDGRYAAAVSRTGVYRVRVAGLTGPSVRLR